mgnify:CR=1 FL=1
MKWFLCGICALILVVVIRTPGDFGNSKAIAEQGSMLPAIKNTDREQELRAENLKLRQQITQLNKEIAQLKYSANGNNSSHQGGAISQVSAEPVEPANIQATLQKNIQEFNNFLASDDSITALKTSFANEVVDSSWATIHQRELEGFFKKSFTDVFPQYIECRSKRCKIIVPVSDQENFSALSQALTQNILNNKDGIAKKIVIEPTGNDGTLNFYLSRNDEVNFLQ